MSDIRPDRRKKTVGGGRGASTWGLNHMPRPNSCNPHAKPCKKQAVPNVKIMSCKNRTMQNPCKIHAKTMQNRATALSRRMRTHPECQAAEPSQSPGSLLYVLYVLYGSHKAKPLNLHSPLGPGYICAVCAIWLEQGKPRNPHSLRLLAIRPICAIWLSQGNPLNLPAPGPCYMYYMCYLALTTQPAELYTIHIASQHVPNMH